MSSLPAFQQYQLAFTAYIRLQNGTGKPRQVRADRLKLYREMVFANIEASLAACFPVCKQVLGDRLWRKLVRRFLAQHSSQSPLFRQIPVEFLNHLEQGEEITPYLWSLAHYEWVELAISSTPSPDQHLHIEQSKSLLEGKPAVVSAMANLRYDYPVHLISRRFKPVEKSSEPVHLVVFRDAEDTVRFVESNAMTARLIEILQEGLLTGRQALRQLADEVEYPFSAQFVEYGHTLMQRLQREGLILGSAITPGLTATS